MIDLKSISKSSPKRPRITIYGPIGVGKTTFGTSGESPIVIMTEDGLGDLVETVPSLPRDENGEPTVATSFEQVLECLQALGEQDHPYKTVVIDSLDWLEPLIWKATSKRIGSDSIEAAGYGKGYVEASTEWREFFKYITALRDFKNMTVVMIAHSAITNVKDPMREAYDTYGMKLHKRASALADEYSDIVGFATIETFLTSEKLGFDKTRNIALTSGNHVLHLSGMPAYTAKNRYHMPSTIALDWEEFEKYLPKVKQEVVFKPPIVEYTPGGSDEPIGRPFKGDF